MPDALVSTDWLHTHLDAPDVRVVDATWFMPSAGARSPAPNTTPATCRGRCSSTSTRSARPGTCTRTWCPSAAKFSARVRQLGLGDGVRIVVYDNNRFIASARVWWLLRFMGHAEVTVLDGGLAKWQAEGRPVDRPAEPADVAPLHGPPEQPAAPRARPDPRQPDRTSRAGGRRALRRAGSTPASPSRGPACAPATSPGSKNLPYGELIAADGTLKPVTRAAAGVRRGRCRPRPAARDHLRLGRLGRGAQPGAVRARRVAMRPSMAARGPNGARSQTRRSRPPDPNATSG